MNENEVKEVLRQHPEMAGLIEYVRGSRHQVGYWRRIPFTRFDPSINELKARLAFMEAGHKSYGKRGLVRVGDRLLPPMAADVKKATEGKRFAPPKMEKIMKDMEKSFEQIAEIVRRGRGQPKILAH